jgi:hypothetical protein
LRLFEQVRQKQTGPSDRHLSASDLNKEYYEEYCKLYIANNILLDKVKEVVEQKEDLIANIKKLQVL